VSTGPLTLNGITTTAGPQASTGSIDITDKSGALLVTPGANILATGGNLKLQNNDIPAGSITIGAGAVLKASSTVPMVGTVTINLGVKVDIAAGTAPAQNVVEDKTGAGEIFYGPNGITALPPNNTLSAHDRNIYFDTDTRATNSIQLGGGVIITADPPDGFATMALPVIPVNLATMSKAASAILPLVPISNREIVSVSAQPAQSITNTSVSAAQPAVSRNAEIGIVNFQTNGVLAGTAALANIVKPASGTLQGMIEETEVLDSTSDSRTVVLRKNERLIFAPTVDTKIVTELGEVTIDAGSVAMVCRSADTLAVYNFDDLHRYAVRIHSGNKSLTLSPGRHAIISSKTASFDSLNVIPEIAHRRVSSAQMFGAGMRMFSSEFSIPSAMTAIKQLRELLNSRQPDAIQVARHMLKTVASLQVINPSTERYQQSFH
jgi:hypothetical protein